MMNKTITQECQGCGEIFEGQSEYDCEVAFSVHSCGEPKVCPYVSDAVSNIMVTSWAKGTRQALDYDMGAIYKNGTLVRLETDVLEDVIEKAMLMSEETGLSAHLVRATGLQPIYTRKLSR
jgi:hypothetical protein